VLEKYSKKNNLEVIFKKGKMIFFGMQEKHPKLKLTFTQMPFKIVNSIY